MDNLEKYFHQFCVRNSKLARARKLVPFYEKHVDRSRTRVLIACLPKSGSTYMTQLLRHHLHFPVHRLVWDYGKSEQELCWSRLAATMDSDALFVQQHLRASESTLHVLRIFNVRTIVMIRNLLDVVVSFRDHIINESPDNPMAYVDPVFFEWETRKQYEFVIDLILPWFLNFIGTWLEANKREDISLLWLNYSDWIQQPEATLKAIDAFCGLSHTGKEAARAVALARKDSIRLNVGKVGRGQELLDDELQAKVHHLVSYYPIGEKLRTQLLSNELVSALHI